MNECIQRNDNGYVGFNYRPVYRRCFLWQKKPKIMTNVISVRPSCLKAAQIKTQPSYSRPCSYAILAIPVLFCSDSETVHSASGRFLLHIPIHANSWVHLPCCPFVCLSVFLFVTLTYILCLNLKQAFEWYSPLFWFSTINIEPKFGRPIDPYIVHDVLVSIFR